MHRSHRILTAIGAGLATLTMAAHADGATITAEYAEGHTDVLINGYHTRGLGSFRLTDGRNTVLAWCIESHVQHSTVTDAYQPVPNRVAQREPG